MRIARNSSTGRHHKLKDNGKTVCGNRAAVWLMWGNDSPPRQSTHCLVCFKSEMLGVA